MGVWFNLGLFCLSQGFSSAIPCPTAPTGLGSRVPAGQCALSRIREQRDGLGTLTCSPHPYQPFPSSSLNLCRKYTEILGCWFPCSPWVAACTWGELLGLSFPSKTPNLQCLTPKPLHGSAASLGSSPGFQGGGASCCI